MGAAGGQIGDFLTALAPGVGLFLIIMGVFVGVGALVLAVVGLIKKKFGKD